MPQKTSLFWSTVGKKILMGLTGIVMIVFLVGHLSGNLMLFLPDPTPFNRYSDFLMGLGKVLILIELVLVAIFLGHVVSGISVTRNNQKARPVSYERYQSAGKPSRKTISSSTMIWTGIILGIFTVVHIWTFKYGPGIAEGYVSTIDGKQVRDLHRLVVETFQKPGWVLWYVAVMAFLGFHLRHGFWSAFQSLGLNHPRYSSIIQTLGIIVALALGAGFLVIPVWLFLKGVS